MERYPLNSSALRVSSALLGASLLIGIGIGAPAAFGDETSQPRGVSILKAGLSSKDAVRAKIRWDKRELRDGGVNALSMTVVALSGKGATPVLTRGVGGSAKQPERQYSVTLSKTQQRLVDAADGLAFAASQKSALKSGLYRRVWVAHTGKFPTVSVRKVLARASRCSPATSGGSYNGCYYGYTDMSKADLSNANFTDAQFPYTTLSGTDFTGANLSVTQMGYAVLTNANLTNTNLTGAYLYGANLSGANISGAIFTSAQFCHTQMPDGSTKNDNC